MRSELLQPENMETDSTERFVRQNQRLLRVHLTGAEEVMARQGAMVAYQGAVDFGYQGSGFARAFKKAFTGEGLPLMKVTGQGDVFLADVSRHVHLITLEGDSITINGRNVLAFETGLSWDIRRVEGASMMTGGLFNTVFSGHGQVAVTSHGEPVILRVDAPTFVDVQAAVGWSSSLTTTVRKTMTAGALIGRGSGEAFQLQFSGSGFVVVQPSETDGMPSVQR